MKQKIPVILIIVISGFFITGTMAQDVPAIPTVINYQGFITDKDGSALTGKYTIIFKLFDEASGTNPWVWQETQDSISVNNGLFNVLLGSVAPIEPNHLAGERYLEVQMEGELEMKPRMRLASVAYSLRSQEANNANYAHILSAPDKEPLEAVVVTNDGNVGVGKSTPQAKLDIEGSMKVSGKFDFPNAFGWNWIDTVATKENSVGWVTAVDIQGKTGILLMVQATGGGDYAGNEVKISIDGAIWKDYKGNANSVGTNGWLIVDDTEDQNAGILTIVPFKTFQNSLKVELYNFSSTHESNIRLNYLVQ